MSEKIRARVLRIDPVARTATEGWDTWETAREWIGAELLERVGCGGEVDVWVDEEGMLRAVPEHWILGGNQMLAGRAVMVGFLGEWSDLPIPIGVAAGAISWIPAGFRGRAQEIAAGMLPMAVPLNAEGLARLGALNREQAGRVELLAVSSVRAVAQESLELGDCVTGPGGITGFVYAIDEGWITVMTMDGKPMFRRSELVIDCAPELLEASRKAREVIAKAKGNQ